MLLAEHQLFILIIDHRFYKRTSINRCSFNIPNFNVVQNSPVSVLSLLTDTSSEFVSVVSAVLMQKYEIELYLLTAARALIVVL